MIREFNDRDLDAINDIGLQIKDNFSSCYKIEEFVNYDYAKVFIYEINNEVVGFLQIEQHFEVIDIINIAVKKENQCQGIASKLITYVVETLNCEKIMLEVKDDNVNAIKTYEKNGFKEINRRKKYYGENDAIIMERIVL